MGQVLQSYITVPPAGSSHETHPQTIPTARILATPPRLTSRAATPGTNDPALPRAIKCMIARPDPFWTFDQQMVVVVHQAIGMTDPAEAIDDMGQQGPKGAAVLVIGED